MPGYCSSARRFLSFCSSPERGYNAGWKGVSAYFVDPAPDYFGSFLGRRDLAGLCIQPEDQVVMEVKRLAFVRGDAMHIHPGQERVVPRCDPNRRLFDRFTSRTRTPAYRSRIAPVTEPSRRLVRRRSQVSGRPKGRARFGQPPPPRK